MDIKISSITNLDKFYELIAECSGKVELVTKEGDRLNLRSKLAQYVALSKYFNDTEIDDLEIIVENEEDAEKLLGYVIYDSAL